MLISVREMNFLMPRLARPAVTASTRRPGSPVVRTILTRPQRTRMLRETERMRVEGRKSWVK